MRVLAPHIGKLWHRTWKITHTFILGVTSLHILLALTAIQAFDLVTVIQTACSKSTSQSDKTSCQTYVCPRVLSMDKHSAPSTQEHADTNILLAKTRCHLCFTLKKQMLQLRLFFFFTITMCHWDWCHVKCAQGNTSFLFFFIQYDSNHAVIKIKWILLHRSNASFTGQQFRWGLKMEIPATSHNFCTVTSTQIKTVETRVSFHIIYHTHISSTANWFQPLPQ